MRLGALAAFCALAVVGAGYFYFPLLTLQRIDKAIEARDTATLEALIDWPQVRNGLKTDFVAPALAKSIAGGGGLEVLGAGIGSALANNMLDALASSSLLTQRAESVHVDLDGSLTGSRFIGPTTYVADIKLRDVPPFSLMLELQGATWRVVRFVPSAEMLNKLQEASTPEGMGRRIDQLRTGKTDRLR